MDIEISQAVAGIKGRIIICEEKDGTSTLKVMSCLPTGRLIVKPQLHQGKRLPQARMLWLCPILMSKRIQGLGKILYRPGYLE